MRGIHCEGEREEGSTGLGLNCSSEVQAPSGRNEEGLAEYRMWAGGRRQGSKRVEALPSWFRRPGPSVTTRFPYSWSVWICRRKAPSG